MLSLTGRRDEFTIISSALGSIALFFSSIAAFHLLGAEPLWLPMKSGGQEFNPTYLAWLVALIPVGSLLGCLVSLKGGLNGVSWLTCLCGWFVGAVIGYIVSWQTAILLGVIHPLLVAGLGLAVVVLVFRLAAKKAQTQPTRIHLPL